MGAMQRKKGHNFEREIAKDFKELGFDEARRHLEYQDGEANGVDISNTGVFRVQCKSKQAYVSVNTINEIQVSDGIHLLLTKANRKPTMAILKWDDLKKILADVGVAYEGVENDSKSKTETKP